MKNSQKKIILINLPPGGTKWNTPRSMVWPSTAILLIASLLKEKGYTVKIIDINIHENYINIIKKHLSNDTIFVGLSVMVSQIYWGLKISEEIKNINRRVKIVWGGPHATLYPEQTVCNDNVDIVVINEGTKAIVNLVKGLLNNTDISIIKGIAFKDVNNCIRVTKQEDCDSIEDIPFFDYSLIDTSSYLTSTVPSVYEREFSNYNSKIKIMPILTGLGCPYKCQFCINVILKRRYRFRAALDIVDEIERLQKKYDVNTFLFFDEDFFISKMRMREFLDLVEKRNLKFNWRMWCRVDHFNEKHVTGEIISRLGRVGYGSLVMGAESGNQSILDDLKKGITLEQIQNSLKVVKNSDKIFPRYSFMVGLEGETFEQACETYRFCLKIKKTHLKADIAHPVLFRLYPGSPIFDSLCKKYDITMPNTLNEWSNFIKQEEGNIESLSFSDMKWMPKKLIKNYKNMDFYYRLAERFFVEKKSVNKNFLYKVLSKHFLYVLENAAIARVKLGYYRLPIEKTIISFFRK